MDKVLTIYILLLYNSPQYTMKTLKPNLVPNLTDQYRQPDNSKRTSSHQWRLLRQSIIERDKYTCQSCGIITHSLEVDHIDTNNLNNDPSNLQTLCSPCHLKKTTAENKRLDSYQSHSERLAKMVAARTGKVTKYGIQ